MSNKYFICCSCGQSKDAVIDIKLYEDSGLFAVDAPKGWKFSFVMFENENGDDVHVDISICDLCLKE